MNFERVRFECHMTGHVSGVCPYKTKMKIFVCALMCVFTQCFCGMLKPRESESRSIQEMNGMWMFRADMSPNRNQGLDDKWYEKPLSEVCMVASYYC